MRRLLAEEPERDSRLVEAIRVAYWHASKSDDLDTSLDKSQARERVWDSCTVVAGLDPLSQGVQRPDGNRGFVVIFLEAMRAARRHHVFNVTLGYCCCLCLQIVRARSLVAARLVKIHWRLHGIPGCRKLPQVYKKRGSHEQGCTAQRSCRARHAQKDEGVRRNELIVPVVESDNDPSDVANVAKEAQVVIGCGKNDTRQGEMRSAYSPGT